MTAKPPIWAFGRPPHDHMHTPFSRILRTIHRHNQHCSPKVSSCVPFYSVDKRLSRRLSQFECAIFGIGAPTSDGLFMDATPQRSAAATDRLGSNSHSYASAWLRDDGRTYHDVRATMSFHLYVVSPMSTQDLVHPEETKRSSTLPSGSPYIESHTVPPTSTTRQNGMSKPRDISIAPDMTEP